MMYVEIPNNSNCAAVDLRVFHDLEPPHAASQVRLERQPGVPAWYEVTGWTASNTPCQALLQKVDDSGEGVAFLLYGGDAGLRLRPAEDAAPWSLDHPSQWGEPFLLVGRVEDVRLLQA